MFMLVAVISLPFLLHVILFCRLILEGLGESGWGRGAIAATAHTGACAAQAGSHLDVGIPRLG